MASPSKEENMLELLFNHSPLRQWHFEEMVRMTGMTRAAANKWLNRYIKQGLIKRIKKRGKFPYFTAGSHNPVYQSRKRLYLLSKLHESGLVDHLLGLKAKTIMIFGSVARGDWYKDSDIDIFMLGSSEGFEKIRFEKALSREIEVQTCKNRQEIRKIRSGLMENVINGYLIKGRIQDLVEVR
ncbi:MAG: nucleotidyltransferase domain-containing protein [Nanoarchaeota archaeon]|nr:nucleotidyltransferase domain-containing protein [Nanoarchaeota archaeon]